MTVVRAALVLAVVVNGAAAVDVAARLAPPGGARRRLLAAGAGVAVLLLAGAAAVSGPLLDALDVGVPSAQVSAGALAAVGALLVLVNGSWGTLTPPERAALDEDRPGGATPVRERRGGQRAAGVARGAVVPLAVPVLAGPGPLAVAVALAGRSGTATALAAVVVAVAAGLAVAVALDRAGAARPWAPPLAARLVAAAAVAASVELAVDGVLGV